MKDNSKKTPRPFKENKKDLEIKSKLHKELGLPGYKENHKKVKSTSKVKLKEFLANFLKGEQQYF